MEEWRPVLGFDGLYEVSNWGIVRSLPRLVVSIRGVHRNFPSKVLNPGLDQDGYQRVKLYKNGKFVRYYSHRLVLEAFVGPKPDGLVIAHNNGIPNDNRLENLRYATHVENEADKLNHGTRARGETCGTSKLTTEQVYEIRRFYDEYKNLPIKRPFRRQYLEEFAAKYGLTTGPIYGIGCRSQWKWLPEENANDD